MGRAPCCEKIGLKKGPWSAQEDQILISYIHQHGHPNWRALPKQAGLLRCGKSCRLRWVNYLSPSIKRGNFSSEEEEAIIKLHEMMGNRWSAIAAKLPGRTDNEIKNIWHTHLKKRLNNKSADKMPSNQNINIDDYPLQINSNGGCSSDVSISTQTVQSPQDSINTTTSTLTTTTTTTHQQEVSVSTSLGEVSEMSQSISSGIQEFNIDDENWWQNLMAEDSHNLNSSCILSPTHPDPLNEFGYGFGFGFDHDQLHDHSSYTTNTSDHHSTGDFWYGVLIGAGGGSPPDILPNF